MQILNLSLLLLTLRVGLNTTGYHSPIGKEFLWNPLTATMGQAPLAIDRSMMQFVDDRLERSLSPTRRLEELVWVISDEKGLGFRFDSLSTKTARASFASRSGNCVAYSLMFVAMARYAGLDAQFQEKVVRRKVKRLNGTRVYCRHLNVVVCVNGRTFEVDPGVCRPVDSRHCQIVGDHVALASFYNNKATESLTSGRYDDAFDYIHRSLGQSREFSPAWVSLGVYYRIKESFGLAERAYRRAIRLDPNFPPALLNLAKLYFIQGKPADAEQAYSQAGGSRKNNPYRFYREALDALADGQLAEAEHDLVKALELESSEVMSRTLIWVRRMQSLPRNMTPSGSDTFVPNTVLANLRAGFSVI